MRFWQAQQADPGGLQVAVGEIEQLVAHLALFSHRGDEAAQFVLHGIAAGLADAHARCRRGEQRAAAVERLLQRIDRPLRADQRADFEGDADAEQMLRAAEVEHLGLRRHRIGHHGQAALSGLQVGGAPVDLHHLAFDAVDGDPVIQLVGLGGVQHDAGEHVAEGALQRQADDDRHHPGRRQQALHWEFEHVAGGGDEGGEEDQRADHVLQQPSRVADPLQQQGADHHRQAARGEQPPEDLQRGGAEVAGHVVRPRRLLQRAHAGVDQHQAIEQEAAEPAEQPPLRRAQGQQPPEQQVEQQDAGRDDQRVVGQQ
ncbi:hypothetical protein D3C78_1023180 [compost metagenome]